MQEEARCIENTDIIELGLSETGLSMEQARQIASAIVFDIIDYIKRNQETCIVYLKGQENK